MPKTKLLTTITALALGLLGAVSTSAQTPAAVLPATFTDASELGQDQICSELLTSLAIVNVLSSYDAPAQDAPEQLSQAHFTAGNAVLLQWSSTSLSTADKLRFRLISKDIEDRAGAPLAAVAALCTARVQARLASGAIDAASARQAQQYGNALMANIQR